MFKNKMGPLSSLDKSIMMIKANVDFLAQKVDELEEVIIKQNDTITQFSEQITAWNKFIETIPFFNLTKQDENNEAEDNLNVNMLPELLEETEPESADISEEIEAKEDKVSTEPLKRADTDTILYTVSPKPRCPSSSSDTNFISVDTEIPEEVFQLEEKRIGADVVREDLQLKEQNNEADVRSVSPSPSCSSTGNNSRRNSTGSSNAATLLKNNAPERKAKFECTKKILRKITPECKTSKEVAWKVRQSTSTEKINKPATPLRADRGRVEWGSSFNDMKSSK